MGTICIFQVKMLHRQLKDVMGVAAWPTPKLGRSGKMSCYLTKITMHYYMGPKGGKRFTHRVFLATCR